MEQPEQPAYITFSKIMIRLERRPLHKKINQSELFISWKGRKEMKDFYWFILYYVLCKTLLSILLIFYMMILLIYPLCSIFNLESLYACF